MKYLLTIIFSCATFLAYGQNEKDYYKVLKHRQNQDSLFRTVDSPLEKEDIASFTGLNYFPFNPDYKVTGTFVKYKKRKAFRMPTTTSRLPEYIRYGEIHFDIKEEKLVLPVYQNKEINKKPGYENYLFLPFTDLTNGEETYEVGRYIDFRMPKGKEVQIDFNMAYNPYCSYSSKYSCPIPPKENSLNIRVEAGEKKYKVY
jgi:uncharacterized protein